MIYGVERFYADGENRTRKAYATRPSNVRVYQFHHIRKGHSVSIILAFLAYCRISVLFQLLTKQVVSRLSVRSAEGS